MAGLDGELRQHPGELLAKRREQELDGSLAGLEQNVAHEPIADDDPYVALVDVTPLDVAHEPAGPRAGMVQSAGGAGEVGPLLIFGSDVQQADSRVRHPQDLLGIDGPHDAILVEVLGLGVHVGPDIDDDDGSLVRGEDRGDARPPHPRQEHLGVE